MDACILHICRVAQIVYLWPRDSTDFDPLSYTYTNQPPELMKSTRELGFEKVCNRFDFCILMDQEFPQLMR